MGQYFALKTDGDPTAAVRELLARLLAKKVVDAVLVPARQAHKNVVMQTLFADDEDLTAADPFAPVVTQSSAKALSSLTFRPHGRPVAVVARSCELRGFTELVKLNQGSYHELLVIGFDCLGRYENHDYLALANADDELSKTFIAKALAGEGTARDEIDIARACQACEHPVPEPVDLRICLVGADEISTSLLVEAVSDKGQEAVAQLGILLDGEAPAGRTEALDKLVAERVAHRDAMFEEYRQRAGNLDGLMEAAAGCINCYNCRVACPVCYCRECVFVTDTFRHDSDQYIKWAIKKGRVKMPTDTVMYHLTRMVHMSTLCVGCGQCSSACPNEIPVMELFRSVAQGTQARFEYLPGRDVEEKQPMSTFYDAELGEVTGQSK